MGKNEQNHVEKKASQNAAAIMEIVNKRFNARLSLLGYSRKEACEKVSVPEQSVHNALNSENITLKTLCVLAIVAGVQPQELVELIEL